MRGSSSPVLDAHDDRTGTTATGHVACSRTAVETEPTSSRSAAGRWWVPTTSRSARVAAGHDVVRGEPRRGADRRPHVGVPLAQAGHRLGQRELALLQLLGEVADHRNTDQGRARVHHVVHDAERQSAQAGLAERELEHRDRVLGRVDRDDHAVAHPSRVAGPVHDHRARGVPDDADADGAQQVAKNGTTPPGAEHDEVRVLRDVQQQVPRGG